VAVAHPVIRRDRIAAFGVHDADGEAVVVVAEPVRETDGEHADPVEVARAVRRAVSREHDIAVRDFRLVPPGTVPRTSSGKLSRTATRSWFLTTRGGDG
jgi:acyl-CoA synthetase (AMP-forming)/AMP-acid ligase II